MDVVTVTLKQKLNLIDRMVTQQEFMRQKQEDAQNQIDKLRSLLKLVIQRTKELQTEVCMLSRNTILFGADALLLFILYLITDRTRHFQEIQK